METTPATPLRGLAEPTSSPLAANFGPTGDEITFDYGTFSGADGFRMTCQCGSRLCRGEVTSEDWRLPELQTRYSGHWSPALAARIASG